MTETVVGTTIGGELVTIPLADVLYLRVRRVDTARTVLAVFAVLAVAAAVYASVALASKESCPFIYVFDGAQYVLDAEPLGGAICHGLRRTDYSRLDHIAPADGQYRLLVRNEVEETQYIDELTLLVFDHPQEMRIIPDVTGRFYEVAHTLPPTRAVDAQNRDLLDFFVATDGIAWQSHMPLDESRIPAHRRHELRFFFPKPDEAQEAMLIVNAGASLWGSNMVREILALLGPKTEDWYQDIEADSPERAALNTVLGRDELYHLKVEVDVEGEWVEKAVIRSGGPLVIDDQVIPLDLSDVTGDSLIMRLRPPFGFWSIDHLAVEYGVRLTLPTVEVPPIRAMDQVRGDVTERLVASDEVNYIMPAVGDRARVTFAAPLQQSHTHRTVLLRSSGYYEIQLPAGLSDRSDLLSDIFATPDACVGFAVEKYLEWTSALRAARQEDDRE